MSEIPKDVMAAAMRCLMAPEHEHVGNIAAALLSERLAQIERDAALLNAKAEMLPKSVTGETIALVIDEMANLIRNQEQKP